MKKDYKKDYDVYLTMARDTLEIKYLTPEDRWTLEQGICFFSNGRILFDHADPKVREAAACLATGSHHIGAVCRVTRSEAKYWELEKRGGKKPPGVRQERMEAWHACARKELTEIRGKNPFLSAEGVAEKIKGKPTAAPMPSLRTLTEFIRGELKAPAVPKSLRLIKV